MASIYNYTRPNLIFWFDAPPRAGAGVFCYIAQHWGPDVHYICVRRMTPERRSTGWKDCDHGKALITILLEKADPITFLKNFIQEHHDSIHIINGFRSLTSFYTKQYLFTLPNIKIAAWSERPNVSGNTVQKSTKQLAAHILYRYYALRYSHKIRVYLPLGMLGIKDFIHYGWKSQLLFPFMYVPIVPSTLPILVNKGTIHRIRFLYVGRFSKNTKGVDILINAVDKLKGNNWQLDLVGGYGDLKDYTISWAKRHPNVSFIGTWPSNEICERMCKYHVVVVPSRFDGWNVVVNEAIHSGVGVIATTQSVSSEIIQASGAGIVIPSGNSTALQTAIQSVIDDPGLSKIWMQKAVQYSSRITSQSVGNYFIDILEYLFIDPNKPKPLCPWL